MSTWMTCPTCGRWSCAEWRAETMEALRKACFPALRRPQKKAPPEKIAGVPVG